MTTPVSSTLTDDDIRRALAAAAASFPAAEPGELAVEAAGARRVIALPRRRGAQLLGLAAALVVAALLIANLGGGGGSLIHKGNPASLADRAAAPEAPKDMYSAGAPTGGTLSRVPVVAGPVSRPAGTAAQEAPRTASDQARIVQTGSIALVVDDGKVVTAISRLKVIAKNAGGYVADEQTQGIGDDPSGSITLRVPVARFAAVIAEISSKGFGAKVVSSTSSGKDVTAQYADTEAQIASLKAARGRYLTILNAAKTVGEILSVQQRVDEVQGQIDRLEGARRVLANQSDLATVTVSVNEKKSEVLTRPEPSGWSKAWHDAGHGFTSGVESLIAHSGRALLVLLLGIVVLLLGRTGWRLARRRLI